MGLLALLYMFKNAGYCTMVLYVGLASGARALAAGAALYTLADGSGPCQITVDIPAEDASYFTIGDRLALDVASRDGFEADSAQWLTVGQRIYDPKTHAFQLILSGAEVNALGLYHGEPVPLRRTVESELYSYVVPVSAVYMEGEESGTVFTIRKRERRYGMEYYLYPVSVIVQEKNDEWAALSASIMDPIVETYNPDLAEGDAVTLAGVYG